MAYIGKAPNTAIVNQATSQTFSGNGSTTAFTLTRSVNVGEDLEVFVNNVQQEPGSGKSYTASGTALTFDEAPPSGTNNVYVIFRGEATINPRLEHDANAALSATTGTFTGDLTVDTNTLHVDATNNRLGVGTASPSTKIHLNESGSANAVQRVQAGVNGYAAQVHLYGNNVGGSAYNAVKSFVNGDSTPQWEITGPESLAEDIMTLHTGGSERARVTSDGIDFRNATGTKYVLMKDGDGIHFGASAGSGASSTVLDDYEEGTWTATLVGSTTNPSSTIETTSARYTKVGRQVFVQGQFSNVDTTGAAGAPRVTGLPFGASTSFATGNVMFYNRFAIGTTAGNVSPYVAGTTMFFYQSTNVQGWAEVAHSAGSNAYLAFTAVYDV